jgi:hypothetical protein
MIEVEGKIDNNPRTILIESGASHSYIMIILLKVFTYKGVSIGNLG